MLDATLLSHAKNVIRTIAPELRDRPVYIVDAAATFDGLPSGHCDCLGWAASGIVTDYDFRERIGSAWKGPGPIVALMTDKIVAEWGVDHFRDGALNVVLHETAHLLPAVDLPQDDCADLFDFPAAREWQRNKRVEAESRPEPKPGTTGDPHDLQFIRRCCHLWARAKRSGWDIPSHHLFGGSLWFVCQPAHWICCLLREVVEMHSATFAEIEQVTPPKEFTTMWAGAMKTYNRFKEQRT